MSQAKWDRIMESGAAGSRFFDFKGFRRWMVATDGESEPGGGESPDVKFQEWLSRNPHIFEKADPWRVLVGYYLKCALGAEPGIEAALEKLTPDVFGEALTALYQRDDRVAPVAFLEFWLLPHETTWDRIAGPLLNHTDPRLQRYGAIVDRYRRRATPLLQEDDRLTARQDPVLKQLVERLEADRAWTPTSKPIPSATLRVGGWRRLMAWCTGRIHHWSSLDWARTAAFMLPWLIGAGLVFLCLFGRPAATSFRDTYLKRVGQPMK